MPVTSHTDGATLTATGLSKVLSDMQSPLLFFGCSDSLWKIAASEVPVDNDPYGNQVQQRYADLAALLPLSMELVRKRDATLYKAPNEYLASIENGRAQRYTEYRTPTVATELSIRASGGSSYYTLIYAFGAGEVDFEADRQKHEQSDL